MSDNAREHTLTMSGSFFSSYGRFLHTLDLRGRYIYGTKCGRNLAHFGCGFVPFPLVVSYNMGNQQVHWPAARMGGRRGDCLYVQISVSVQESDGGLIERQHQKNRETEKKPWSKKPWKQLIKCPHDLSYSDL